MELIATSRIARAQQRVTAAQPYTRKMNEVIRNVAAASGGASHPLLEARPERTAGGLVGANNINVMRFAELRMIDLVRSGTDVRVYVVGKKAHSYFRYRGYQIQQAFLGVTGTPGYGDARAGANVLMNDFAEGAI